MLFTRLLGLPTDHMVYLICNPAVLDEQVLKSGGNRVNCCDETWEVMSEQQQVVS